MLDLFTYIKYYHFLNTYCYLKGSSSRWSAHRIRAENEDKFDAIKAVREGRPVMFTGEVM